MFDSIYSRSVHSIDVGSGSLASNYASDYCYSPIQVRAMYGGLFAPLVTQEPVKNIVDDFSSLLAAGVGCGAISALCVLVAAYLVWRRSRIELSWGAHVDPTEHSGVKKMIVAAFRHMHMINNTSADSLCADSISRRTETLCPVISVVGSALSVLCVFLILYFVTSSSYTSNVEVMIEEHSNPECGVSPVAPTPTRVGYVAKDVSRICTALSFTGTSGSRMYAAAFCSSSAEAEANVHVRVGYSLVECAQSPFVVVPSGSCVKQSMMIPSLADRGIYLSFTCGSSESVRTRFQSFARLTNRASHGDVTLSLSLAAPYEVRQAQPDSGLYQFESVQQSTYQSTRSFSPSRFESNVYPISDASSMIPIGGLMVPYFYGTDLQNLILQSDEGFSAPTVDPYLLPITEQLQNDIADRLTQPFCWTSRCSWDDWECYEVKTACNYLPTWKLLYRFAPRVQIELSNWLERRATDYQNDWLLRSDFPQGNTYNNFNKTSSKRDKAAGPQARRYYGMRGTPADVGLHFNDQTPERGGFTISVYLKATRTTKGFAFAITDGWEDLATGTSPIIDTAIDVLGGATEGWYTGDYHVYSSLYVDGAEEKLTFFYADPTVEGDSTVSLQWDLSALGLTRVFNGAWHRVVIIMHVTNKQPKALLVVDGETSNYKFGFNKCMPRSPARISDAPAGTAFPVTNVAAERVYANGMLYTGYFNGGIAQLEFTPSRLNLYDLLRSGTFITAGHSNVKINHLLVLGLSLGCIGVILLITLLIMSCCVYSHSQRQTNEETHGAAENEYNGFWHAKPLDDHGIPFAYVSWTVGQKWIGNIGEREFVLVAKELRLQFDFPERELVRSMYYCGMGHPEIDKSFQQPTAAQWNSLRLSTPEYGPSFVQNSDFSNKKQAEEMTERTGNDRGASADQAGKSSGKSFSSAPAHEDAQVVPNDKKEESSSANPLWQILLPVIMSLQTVYIWFSSIYVSPYYMDTFEKAFSFIFFDLSAVFAKLPTMVTPLVQLFFGAVILGGLLCFVWRDETTFLWYVARYTLVRDEFVFGEGKICDRGELFDGLSNPFGEVPHEEDTEGALLKEVFGVEASKSLQIMSTAASSSSSTTTTTVRSGERVFEVVGRDEGNAAMLQEVPGDKNNTHLDNHLTPLDPECPCHPRRRLSLRHQSRILPFSSRVACCAVINGSQCTNAIGDMYVCSASVQIAANHVEETSSTTRRCPFALCVTHNIRSELLVNAVLTDAVTTVRGVADAGLVWFLTSLFLTLADVFYTPFVRTAVMLATCHPTYQCTLKSCWGRSGADGVDQQFIIVAFLSLTFIFVYGILFPLGGAFLLRRRRHLLFKIFLGASYANRFGSDPWGRSVNPTAWQSFVASDPSAISQLYKSFHYRWMYIAPILSIYKVASLVPTLIFPLFTTDDFYQAVGISVVELAFGLFVFVSNPTLSPFLAFSYRLSACHQLIFLGTQMVGQSLVFSGSSMNLQGYLVGITAAYLVASLALMILSRLQDTIQRKLERRRVNKVLRRFGIDTSLGKMWFRVPPPFPCDDTARAPESPLVSTKMPKRGESETSSNPIRSPRAPNEYYSTEATRADEGGVPAVHDAVVEGKDASHHEAMVPPPGQPVEAPTSSADESLATSASARLQAVADWTFNEDSSLWYSVAAHIFYNEHTHMFRDTATEQWVPAPDSFIRSSADTRFTSGEYTD